MPQADGAARRTSYDPEYPPEIWRPLVERLISADYPRIAVPVAMQWLTMESDGAPCAFGRASELGPDGFPREIGLGQLYNPDDFKLLKLTERGITPTTLRSYCVPGTQRRSRALTDEEMEQQVRHAVLDLIQRCMGEADRTVARFGLQWSPRDYWTLVKSFHAMPVISDNGMPAVAKKIGRAPRSWSEFREALGMNANPTWAFALDNAEKLGAVMA